MLKFLADENISRRIVDGARRRKFDLDIIRVHDVDLLETPDPEILEFAARENRIVVTHDVSTMTAFAYARVAKGLRMPGVLEIPDGASLSAVLDDLILIVECGISADFEDQVHYLPL